MVTEQSPGRLVASRLQNRDQLKPWFRLGGYELCDEATGEREFEAVITRIWDSFRTRYQQSLSEALGMTVRGDDREESPKLQRFNDARTALGGEGHSARRWVRVRALWTLLPIQEKGP